mmetsp:Transcript_27433/g.64073  ORF Transcript_27433/g.64073 Transcript_27433/m.64073 type:complete len:157 (+) Transcript_27433:111-581(+)
MEKAQTSEVIMRHRASILDTDLLGLDHVGSVSKMLEESDGFSSTNSMAFDGTPKSDCASKSSLKRSGTRSHDRSTTKVNFRDQAGDDIADTMFYVPDDGGQGSDATHPLRSPSRSHGMDPGDILSRSLMGMKSSWNTGDDSMALRSLMSRIARTRL